MNQIKNKIITYHVGGRSGSIGFPEINKYCHEIEKYIFEADEDCIDQIKAIHPNSRVISKFIGEDNKKIKFFINYCPYTSSIFELNQKYGEFYHKYPNNTDYVFKHTMKPVKSVEMVTSSLDSLFLNKTIEPADFLSIDTQGSEYDILMNSPKLLNENILAINCEVSFADLYKNSTLFPKIHDLLLSYGFLMVNLETIDIGYYRLGKIFRGKGIPLQGEALYLRDPNSQFFKKNFNKILSYKKLAFIAIAFGFTEFAYKIIKDIDCEKSCQMEYDKFLIDFKRIIKNQKDLPKLWNEEISFEESSNRFKLDNISANNKNNIKKVIDKIIRLKNRIFWQINKLLFNNFRSSFIILLENNGFDLAIREIKKRYKGPL